jgi:hypothetical protein
MGGAVLPLPQYAFMAWCSVRRSTGKTFHLYLLLTTGVANNINIFLTVSIALQLMCIVNSSQISFF